MLKNIEMHSNDKIHHLYIAVFCNIHKGQFTLNNHDLSTSSRDYRALWWWDVTFVYKNELNDEESEKL